MANSQIIDTLVLHELEQTGALWSTSSAWNLPTSNPSVVRLLSLYYRGLLSFLDTNGSGKSNILDALLFCLGLASSKGMRADRLPDLVNNAQTPKARSAVEASVTVTFNLGKDTSPKRAQAKREEAEAAETEVVETEVLETEVVETEVVETEVVETEVVETQAEENPKSKSQKSKLGDWSVTRKLRVTQQGTYTSNYYINGIGCTLTELHEELETLRIYPEGYNVVLQGDVTSIISMNSRERREIIDELAGVATYDRKIVQAKKTLDEVKEKEDSCRIIETELTVQRDRLSQDRAKAEKYQKLRTEFQHKQSWEAVLSWRSLQAQQEKLVAQIQTGDRTFTELTTQLTDS